MSRKLSLISQSIGELLVKQIAHELKNYTLYLSFANYFSIEGVEKLNEYYKKRADEELDHATWIRDYLADADYNYMYPAVDLNTEKIVNIEDPFVFTVNREILTTNLIYNIYEAALAEKDFMTTSWLYDKLIKEQIEEENISRMALTIMQESADIFVKSKNILNLIG